MAGDLWTPADDVAPGKALLVPEMRQCLGGQPADPEMSEGWEYFEYGVNIGVRGFATNKAGVFE